MKDLKNSEIITDYIQVENLIYSVSGGGALDNLVEKVLEKARGKILEKSYLTNLTISIR